MTDTDLSPVIREGRRSEALRLALERLVRAVRADVEAEKVAAMRHAEDELRRWTL